MKKRILSAVVLIAIFVPLLIIGGIPFTIFLSIAALGGMYELINARKKKKDFPLIIKIFGYFLTLLVLVCNYLTNRYSFNYYFDIRLLALLIFAYVSPIVFTNDSKKYNLNDALFMLGSTVFLGVSFSLLIAIRNSSITYIIYMFLISCITDTFALLTGMKIGKRKLAPLISPNKTIEGFIGGSIMGTFVATVYFLEVVSKGANVFVVIGMTLFLSILGQVGDLVFSAIKRYYGTKDFSNLIPGHGGILDRLDSIIFIVLGFVMFMIIL